VIRQPLLPLGAGFAVGQDTQRIWFQPVACDAA